MHTSGMPAKKYTFSNKGQRGNFFLFVALVTELDLTLLVKISQPSKANIMWP